jgi:tetratricopeptide (TPR) repeat protein
VTCDGQELDAAGVAAFGDSLNLRTRAQLLLSLQACVQCRWARGYLGLRTAVMALLGPTCALWLEPLTMRMLSALLDIQLNATRVQRMLMSRTLYGEALEVAGQYMRAAALYEQNAKDLDVVLQKLESGELDAGAMRADLLGLNFCNERCKHYCNFGLALKRAGEYEKAERMYVHALGLAEQGWGAPQEKSESDRIRIHHLMLSLYSDTEKPSKVQAAFESLFKAQMELLKDDERVLLAGVSSVATRAPLLTSKSK